MSRYCAVIPSYNHVSALPRVLAYLQNLQLPSIIIDDGSKAENKETIEALQSNFPLSRLYRFEINQGKGQAVMCGLKKAYELGFSHALQIDADGQHTLEDIEHFLAKSQSAPEVLFSGFPKYDNTAPLSRVYGRKITNFWVSVETWSTCLKESMCGFRIYPLAAISALFSKKLSKRMGFDIDVLVRLYWQGVPICYIETKVNYPVQNHSNFKMLRDNLAISGLHTKLFFLMFYYMPRLKYITKARVKHGQKNK